VAGNSTLDNVDLSGSGSIQVKCAGNYPNTVINPQTQDITTLYFNGTVALGNSSLIHNHELAFNDLLGASLSDIIIPALSGGALLRADATVDFSTLGASLANVLPKVTAHLLVDFVLSWSPSTGLNVSSPQVVISAITLDLGSFISNFAAPILQKISDVLQPLAWLIGTTTMRRVELIAAVVLVLVIELLNTAIEKLADRLTTDHDPQIGRVKDMGSAAVGVALVMAGLFWLFAIGERIGAI